MTIDNANGKGKIMTTKQDAIKLALEELNIAKGHIDYRMLNSAQMAIDKAIAKLSAISEAAAPAMPNIEEALKHLRKWFETELAAMYLAQGSLDDIHDCKNQIDMIDTALASPSIPPAQQEKIEKLKGCRFYGWLSDGTYIDNLDDWLFGDASVQPSSLPAGEGPSWWHHVDEHGRDVFMNMSFDLPNETALYIHPASTAPAESTQELIELLKSIRPNFGDVGTRDIDVRYKQEQIEKAIDALCRCAPKAAMSNETVKTINAAFAQYDQDLKDRKHGGVSMDSAWHKIRNAWKAEFARANRGEQ